MITAVDASVADVARGDTRLGVAGALREVDPVAMELVNVLEEVAPRRLTWWSCLTVLKAHCLERAGSVEEAPDICRRVQLKKPTDDTLLNTMNLVFKLVGSEHEMLPSYEHACAVSSPPDEGLFQSLFVAYARRGTFLKQQQMALKMFKAFGNTNAQHDAVGGSRRRGGTPARMLALAEKMPLKTLRKTGADDGEALQLTVLIMQLQDNHQGAPGAFDEFVKVNDDCKTSKKEKPPLGRDAEGEGAYDEEIELGPMQAIDRLSLEATLAKKEYIAARFEKKADGTPAELLTLGEEITAFLNELQTRSGNERIRGPALSMIHVSNEILNHLQTGETTASQVEATLQALIVAYADRFYAKACCTDLKQYITLYRKDPSPFQALESCVLLSRLLGGARDAQMGLANRGFFEECLGPVKERGFFEESVGGGKESDFNEKRKKLKGGAAKLS
ncbi:Mitochondrial inheritance and actin cytoskeleton organization protein [Phytophthora cinnamomi]|uniref:Mitochondrial inheritance and actin cytoskeleton organization protein n=1 Tax=Phytophthora cinnamomi TaxID=4785 RepID=UPI00355AC35C|nr:Mitochondrial inheritance and actin cytoskeleton organization protein [Phytophthora cinnamomi]